MAESFRVRFIEYYRYPVEMESRAFKVSEVGWGIVEFASRAGGQGGRKRGRGHGVRNAMALKCCVMVGAQRKSKATSCSWIDDG